MRIVKISKKNGKFRTIYIPSKGEAYELKKIKRKLDWLYLKLGIPESVHGFIYGRNAVTNATQHINFDYTISMDLENFFDNVGVKHLNSVPPDLLEKTIINGAPRQGLCTSPTLSNIAMIEFDRWAESLDCVYTRYADDITISSNNLDELKRIKDEIECKLNEMGFTLNNKTKLQTSKGGRRIITGLSVDSDVRRTRKIARKLRAAQHQNNKNSANGLKEWAKCPVPLDCNWVAKGDIDNPYIVVEFDRYITGRRGYTKTFKGSRAVFFRYLGWRMARAR